jgi:chromatin remodeling complex protein RSC6
MPSKKPTEKTTPAAAAETTKKPKKVAAKQEAPVPPPPPVEVKKETVPEVVEEPGPIENTLKDFAEFQQRLSNIRTNLSNLLQDFKTLQKKTERELKNAQKAGSKRKRKTGARQPSGFVKPTLISNELADFLGKAHGSELARTEVTREINAYIRANKLQDPSNGRKINPDTKLKKLLSIKAEDELTYFNLQRYMSPHFQKLGQTLNVKA